MPASQTAATERRNDRTITHEPPKLKTTLKTPPKQATNPLQFVKVGPCSLYRTAQEQLQKVQEVKKIKQEVREDPEDWQSNLDNWKSSRRKRQEHIIERVVEVKKLELEEHDRQRRRSKTFSEMMEERGNRGRKLSMSLNMYHEEDSNDLSDLGIGTSSGKSSVSGDTHDDTHSVLSDRDSEIEKNHSDVDNAPIENGNELEKKSTFGNGFHNNHNNHNNHEYDSAATATASSPEPEEYTYEGAIRGYVSRVAQNIPRRSLANLEVKLDNSKSTTNGSKSSLNEETNVSVVKVDILKRREIFEKTAQKNTDTKTNNRVSSDFPNKSIKDRLSHLVKQKNESENFEKNNSKALNRLSGDMHSIRERLSHLEKQASEREKSNLHEEDLEAIRPLRERLSTLEKYCSSDESSTPATGHESRHNGELSARSIKDRLSALDVARNKEEKRNSSGKHNLCFRDPDNRVDNSTPSERSSSPDSEYRAPRAPFHRSLDSLDADASSGPDTFERVQSLEELDYTRRYPASSSSAEILNDTDREDSGIHTADVSCSVSQADEPIDEEILHNHVERQQVIEEKPELQILEVLEIRKERKEELRKEELRKEESRKGELKKEEVRKGELRKEEIRQGELGNEESRQELKKEESSKEEFRKEDKEVKKEQDTTVCQREAVTTMKGTAESSSGEQSSNKIESQTLVVTNNSRPSSSRPIVYQSPKVPPRRTPPKILKLKSLSTTQPEDSLESRDFTQSRDLSESATKSLKSKDSSESVVKLKVSLEKVVQPAFKLDLTEDPSREKSSLESSDSSPSSPPTPTLPAFITRSQSGPLSPQDSKISPCTSPRTSKIPTPLPRKTINKSSDSSSSSPANPSSLLTSPISPLGFPVSSILIPCTLSTSPVSSPLTCLVSSTPATFSVSSLPLTLPVSPPLISPVSSPLFSPVSSLPSPLSSSPLTFLVSSPPLISPISSAPSTSPVPSAPLTLPVSSSPLIFPASSAPLTSVSLSSLLNFPPYPSPLSNSSISSSSSSLTSPISSSPKIISAFPKTISPSSPKVISPSPKIISPKGFQSPKTISPSSPKIISSPLPPKFVSPSSPKTFSSSPPKDISSLTPKIVSPALPPKFNSPSSPKGPFPSPSKVVSSPPPSSPKAGSPKTRSLSKTSEIPVPIPTSPTSTSKLPLFKTEETSASKSPASSCTISTQVMDSRPAERGVTVVDVWEKVVVPQGQTPKSPITPFISVEYFKNDQDSEEPPVIEKAVEEMICQTIKPVDREEVEVTVSEVEIVSQRKTELESQLVQQEPQIIAIPSIPEKLERPSTLNFIENPKSSEMFSPLSQGSTPIFQLNLTSDEEIVSGLTFPMGPPTSIIPPTEKPPPPPVELSDEESHPVENLKRLNSTRRIKKELRTRRSDFLGIGGLNDDDFERELMLTKPPDMAAILAEERRIEQLHRRSYDTDSNYDQDSSHERDSGVELGHVEDWTKQPVSPDISEHSRQSSEPFGASVTSSEEDEITKKEREIIEVLEKEEQWRYENSRELNSDIGEKLAHKLRELEEEKMQLERERAQEAEEQRRQEETMRKNEENIRKQEEIIRKQQEEIARQEEAARVAEAKRLDEKRKDEELRVQTQEKLKIQNEIEESEKKTTESRRQEEIMMRNDIHKIKPDNKTLVTAMEYDNQDDEFSSGDVLRVERELLQLEQEELQRKRNNLAYREQKQQQLAQQLQEQWKSLQDVGNSQTRNSQQYKLQTPLNYRSSMPNLQMQDAQRRRPPPPPIPPAKPIRMVEQRQRDVTIRNSRVPSADSIPQQVDASIRHSASATMLANHGGQQMSRQTLQALSAVPRSRIVQSDQWVQRRKSDVPRGAQEYNYQHWLIQEAEQRRIVEKNQRSPVRKPQHVTGTSVPYTTSPPRSDSKPLPDSIIQTLTQRVQARAQEKPIPPRRRIEQPASQEITQKQYLMQPQKTNQTSSTVESQEKMLSVSGKKKCSHCGDELGRGAAMIIESLRLFYHMECFKCCVCHVRLGDGLMGTDVRVRNHKLHCHNCYSSDDGVKFSCV